MARLSVSEAARQAGISRQYFYKKFINNGTITVSEDEAGNKFIDDSELLRVFGGRLPKDKPPSTRVTVNRQQILHQATPQNDSLSNGLQVEVQLLREQLLDKNEQIRKAEEREQRLMAQVDNLTAAIKQIEHKPEAPQQRWWNKKLW
jgi:hypothetical protein